MSDNEVDNGVKEQTLEETKKLSKNTKKTVICDRSKYPEYANREKATEASQDPPKIKTTKGRGGIKYKNNKKTHSSKNRFVSKPAADDDTSTRLESAGGWVLFVTGLIEETTEEDLEELFSNYGKVASVVLNLDRRTGFAKGYGLIEYKTYKEALKAQIKLNNTIFLGVTINVDFCFKQKPEGKTTYKN